MLRLKRRAFNLSLLANGAAALVTPALTGRASAAHPVLIASLLGENKPETKVWLKIRDLVEAALPGRFAFNIVPNAALPCLRGHPRASCLICRFSSAMPTMSARRSLRSPVPR